MRELQEPGKRSFPATIENLKPTLEMRELTADTSLAYAVALLKHYGFELRGYRAQELVNLWLKKYSAHWVRLAVIEALYQGRYKAVSVEQILAVWARRGQPIHRFNHEFERLISRKLPQKLAAPLETPLPDLNLEPNLLLVTSKFPDTIDDSVGQEAIPTAAAPTAKQDAVPPTAILTEEEAIAPVPLNDPGKESRTDVGLRYTYDANWSRCEVNKQPIHQFTPPPDFSDFYFKLKAVVQQQEEIPAQIETPLTEEAETEPPPSDTEHN